MTLAEEAKGPAEPPPKGLTPTMGVRAQQLKPLLLGRPILERPGLSNPDGKNLETKISCCPMEKEQREVYKRPVCG